MSYGFAVPKYDAEKNPLGQAATTLDEFPAQAEEALQGVLKAFADTAVRERVEHHARTGIAVAESMMGSGELRPPFQVNISGHVELEVDGKAGQEWMSVQVTGTGGS